MHVDDNHALSACCQTTWISKVSVGLETERAGRVEPLNFSAASVASPRNAEGIPICVKGVHSRRPARVPSRRVLPVRVDEFGPECASVAIRKCWHQRRLELLRSVARIGRSVVFRAGVCVEQMRERRALSRNEVCVDLRAHRI